MNIDEFARQVHSVREVVRASRSPGKTATRWLSLLEVFLEELDVSVEELREQNEELRLTHHLLQRETERYRELFDLAPDGYVVTDSVGVIREANRAASELLRVEPSALVGKPLSVYIDPHDRRLFRRALRDLPESELPNVLTVKVQPRDRIAFNAELSVRPGRDLIGDSTVLRWMMRDIDDRDRHLRETQAISTALERRIAEQQHALQAALAERDASLRREAALLELAAQASTKLSYLAEASNEISASSDLDVLMTEVLSRFVSSSADWAIIGLVDGSGGLGESAVAHHDHECDRAMKAMIGAAEFEPGSMLCCARRTIESEMPQSLAKGDRFPAGFDVPRALEWFVIEEPMRFSVMSVPLRSRGHTLGVLELGRGPSWAPFNGDELAVALLLAGRTASVLDSLKLSEHARKSSDAHDHFIAEAAHELRTPITILRGYAQLFSRQLAGTAPPDSTRNYRVARAIEDQADRLTALVQQLIDASQLESGLLELQPEVVDLSRLILRQVEAARAMTARHEVTTHLESDTFAPVDVVRFEQVVAHLLDNAIKFSVDGGPISVRLERSSDGSIRLIVTDYGIGVAPHHRDHIFTRFYLGHDRSDIHGLGLGLFKSRQIMRQHGGDLRVEFSDDGGSSFVAELPSAGAHPNGVDNSMTP